MGKVGAQVAINLGFNEVRGKIEEYSMQETNDV
jgi:hypothetical protein